MSTWQQEDKQQQLPMLHRVQEVERTEAEEDEQDGEGAEHGRGAGGERHDDPPQRRELAEDPNNLEKR